MGLNGWGTTYLAMFWDTIISCIYAICVWRLSGVCEPPLQWCVANGEYYLLI